MRIVLILLFILIVSSLPAFAVSYDFNSCGFGNCFVYNHSEDSNFELPIPPNYMFDIMMPDGTCNIIGHITQKGDCSSPSIILSNDNFTAFQNNIGVMAVLNIHKVTITQTENYCPLAYFTLQHQDQKFLDKYHDKLNLIYPEYCQIGKPIPEFGFLFEFVYVIAIASAIFACGMYEGRRK